MSRTPPLFVQLLPQLPHISEWSAFCRTGRMSVENPNELPGDFRKNHRPIAADQMTLSQASYLMTLCEETGEVLDDSLSWAEASELIQRLERATGRAA